MSHTHHTYLKLLPRRPPLLMLMMHRLSSELGSQRILSPSVADFNLSVTYNCEAYVCSLAYIEDKRF